MNTPEVEQFPEAEADCLKTIRDTAARFKHKKRNSTLLISTELNGYQYEVDLDRINEPIDLIAWTRHLNEKRWFDHRMLNHFIVMVCEIKGWDPYKT